MDIDSDDGDVFDPLLKSIIDAMNTIKEATADKIYQKVRKEDNNNFSKPQVDRALARALDYGIFEVHNNRYRIRDVNLDDEDTVYQKKNNKNREQTPYRSSEMQNKGDLNPERDNRRYRSLSNEENQFCPDCGRRKKPIEKGNQKSKKKPASRDKSGPKSKSSASSAHKIAVSRNSCKEKSNGSNKKNNTDDGNKRTLRKQTPPKEQNRKRKLRSSSSETERQKKLQKRSNSKKCLPSKFQDSRTKKNAERGKTNLKAAKQKFLNQAKTNVKPTSTAYLRNKRPKSNKKKYTMRRRQFLSDEEKDDEENPTTSNVRSSKSKEGKSESDISVSKSSERSEDKREKPSTSKTVHVEEKNKTEKGGKEMKASSNKESHLQESAWLDQPPGPFHQGIVKQTNNSLILQPMDSLPFRHPEDTSYFT